MRITTLLTDLAACLCAAVEDAKGVCFCGIVPGNAVALDYQPDCFGDPAEPTDGMAWVRLALGYPASEPGIVEQNPRMIPNAVMGYDIEVGIARSLPLSEEPLTPEEIAPVLDQQIADMETMRTAIMCCAELKRGDYILTNYQPIGPLGGAIGGTWTLMVHPI